MVDASDTYRMVGAPAHAELRVDDSRFIAEAMPVHATDEAEARIDAVRQREHKATHHCTAYRIGADGHTFRYNDDGEPSGTAGPPILRQIDAHGLTNTLVVVTRYFGGTKLGTGGLVRAYGNAAAAVLDIASIEERVERVPIQVRFAYDDTTAARQAIRHFNGEVQDETYSDVTELTVGVRRSNTKAFIEAFTNALGGRGEVRWKEEGEAGEGG